MARVTYISFAVALLCGAYVVWLSREYNEMVHPLLNSSAHEFHLQFFNNESKPALAVIREVPKTSGYRCPKAQPNRSWLTSQSGEDVHLLLFFNGLCNGTYVELGALDGKKFSNTHVFNKAFGWKGVLVELSPGKYEALRQNRPDEIAVINAAVCAEQGVVHYVDSGAVGGIWEFAAPSFRKQWWKNKPTKEIKCLPLRDVFLGIATPFYADIFSLDVEGAELEVLQSVDFSKAAFGIILVEADTHNTTKNIAVRELLVHNGYSFLYNHQRSDWFINQQYRDIYQSPEGPMNHQIW